MLERDKASKLQGIKKETEIHVLLKDLLPYMGYENVVITHESGNVPEYGKDLIASMPDKIDEINEWIAFAVKKGDITGTSRMNMELKAQVQECFEYPYDSLKFGKVNISKVRIVTNGKVNSGAKQKFFKDKFYNNPNVIFWGNDELVKFIDKYYPRFWLSGSKNYKHYIELFQSKNKYDDFTKILSLNDTKIEKLLKNTIKLKLAEYYYDEEIAQFRRKWFEVEDLNKVNECSLIVGESGSGKTTLFKQIANNIIYENSIRNDYEFYPIIIKFRNLEENNFNIENAIHKYFEQESYSSLNFNVEELFEKKNFILFIDALDEIGVKEKKDKALEAIKKFNDEYSTIKIFCSSRNSDSLLGTCRQLNFKYFDIINISIQQAETFIDRYFDDEELKGKRLIKSIKDSRILDKLPKTPLTLTLLTSLFDEDGYEIPATISDLYKYFVDILLSKNIKESHSDLLKVGIHRSVLSYIAEHLHVNRLKSIPREDLIVLIQNFATERAHKYNVNDLLNDLVQDINLLIENERGEIEFKHLSFQEYFTAYQFYNHSINGKSEFINNFNDVWWQNVAIFYAGMTKDSPQLIDDIINHSVPQNFHEYIVNVSGLGYLIQALYNTPVENRHKAVLKNIESIQLALKFISNTVEDKYADIKSFLHTTYGANKILAFWFEFHHTSITLKVLLSSLFDEMITKLESDTFSSSEEKKEFEYSAYLIAASLTNIEFDDFNNYFRLLNLTDSDNFVVQGLIESDFNNKFKTLSKEDKRRKNIKKFETRLSFLDNKKIDDKVNISLKDGQKVKKLRQFKK